MGKQTYEYCFIFFFRTGGIKGGNRHDGANRLVFAFVCCLYSLPPLLLKKKGGNFLCGSSFLSPQTNQPLLSSKEGERRGIDIFTSILSLPPPPLLFTLCSVGNQACVSESHFTVLTSPFHFLGEVKHGLGK